MQISSVTLQNDDKVQLLKQMLSRHVGVETSHHLHRLKLRRVRERPPRGGAVGDRKMFTSTERHETRVDNELFGSRVTQNTKLFIWTER